VIRAALLSASALGLSGCLSWQANYDNAARADCRDLVDADEGCLDRV
jgi:hypothetical protein